MNLKSYLAERRIKQRDFALTLGTTPATVSRLVSGKLRPSLEMAHQIEIATRGAVKTEAWLA